MAAVEHLHPKAFSGLDVRKYKTNRVASAFLRLRRKKKDAAIRVAKRTRLIHKDFNLKCPRTLVSLRTPKHCKFNLVPHQIRDQAKKAHELKEDRRNPTLARLREQAKKLR